MKTKTLLFATALSLAAVSCEKKETSDATQPKPSGNSIQEFIVSTAPEGALSITEVRKATEVGKEITIKGTVMGRKEPFVDGRALVLIGDPDIITSCDLRHGDNCPTPWDVCCDDHDAIKASTATIQILDSATGSPLKQSIKGINGIKELSQLVITGNIAEGSNADNLLVNATGIFVKQ